MEIKLISLKARGFQGLKDLEVQFSKTKTEIFGGNGLGKSSIGDAITFAFTGKNMNGATRVQFQNIDSDSPELFVKVVFEMDGVSNELIRKSENQKMVILFNGAVVNQNYLNEVVNQDILLVSMNPMYFLNLDPTPARRMIANMLPQFTKETVLDSMSIDSQNFLKNEDFDVDNPQAYINEKTKEVKALKQKEEQLVGYISHASQILQAPIKVESFEEILFNLNKEIENIQKEQELYFQNRKPISSKEELDKELHDLLNVRFHIQQTVTNESKRFDELTHTLQLIDNDINNLAQQQFVNQELLNQINNLEQHRAVMISQYESKQKTIQKLQQELTEMVSQLNDNCPTCNTVLTEEKKYELQNKLRIELNQKEAVLIQENEELNSMIEQGKNISLQLTQLKSQYQKENEEFNIIKEKNIEERKALKTNIITEQNNLQPVIYELEQRRQVALQKQSEKINELELRISRLEKENEHNINKDLEITNKFRERLFEVQGRKDNLQQQNATYLAYLEQENKRKQDLEAAIKTKEELLKNIDFTSSSIEHMKKFSSAKVKMLHEQMDNHLNDVNIVLQKVVESTGEIKDTFEVFYQNKPLQVCSLSEQIKTGLEISHMINQLHDIQYPVFIDNSESIVQINTPHSQQIIARVVDSKELYTVSEDASILQLQHA